MMVRDKDEYIDEGIWDYDTEPIEVYRTQSLTREIEALKKENKDLKKNIIHLLKQVGRTGVCNGCGREIFFVHHENGRWAPYTTSGLPHFIDCPKAKQFRKKKP